MNDVEIHAIAVSIEDGEWFDDTQDMLKFAHRIIDAALERSGVGPVAEVVYLERGGSAGIATRIVEIDDPYRERLQAGAKLYTAPQPAQQAVDWTQAGKLIEVVSDHRVRQHITGTTNWAAAVCRLMAEETRPVKQEERP